MAQYPSQIDDGITLSRWLSERSDWEARIMIARVMLRALPSLEQFAVVRSVDFLLGSFRHASLISALSADLSDRRLPLYPVQDDANSGANFILAARRTFESTEHRQLVELAPTAVNDAIESLNFLINNKGLTTLREPWEFKEIAARIWENIAHDAEELANGADQLSFWHSPLWCSGEPEEVQ
ncbi:MAG: hypothetical protein AB8B85_01745, partial [Paracoccaceae bacterium]